MMKAAIYCRLSEEDRNKRRREDDSGSIQNQKAMLTRYALDQGWEIYDVYSDDDYTGADRNRPQFRRLLADGEAGKFQIILCKTQSRFTRELELVEKYIHGLFPMWGIRFVSIVDNGDTANQGNKKSRQINGLVNEWYLEDLSDNIRSVLTSRRENGFHIGSFAPYGYRKDPEHRGHLIIDPEAASIVREIFSLFAAGTGKSAIARQLNDRGVPNPTEYKCRQGLRYQAPRRNIGRLWSYASVHRILTNEVYIGNLVQGRYGSISYKTKAVRIRPREDWIRAEHTHEPIIQQDLWNRVQSRIDAHHRPFGGGGIHPLSGKVRCISCGASLSLHKSHGRRYLQCSTRQVATDACRGAFMPAAELEQLLLEELRALSKALLDREMVKQTCPIQEQARRNRTLALLDSCQRQKENYTAALGQLCLDRAKGTVTEEEYQELAAAFTREKGKLEQQIARGREELAAQQSRLGAGEKELLRRCLWPETLTRAMTEFFIDHIEIGKRSRETGTVPVFIYWNF